MQSGFYTMIAGEVESCQMVDADNLYCKYSLSYGLDWNVLHGLEHGISQIARLSSGRTDQTFVWNYPIDITFRSTNVYGWPQLVFTVYSNDMMGKDIVRGYGCTHLPTTPGRHVRYVRLYTPRSSSMCQQFTSWLTGNPPEFFNFKFVAQGKGREVTRVKSNGSIKIVINVTTRNMHDWGYDVDGERTNIDVAEKERTISAGAGGGSSLLPMGGLRSLRQRTTGTSSRSTEKGGDDTTDKAQTTESNGRDEKRSLSAISFGPSSGRQNGTDTSSSTSPREELPAKGPPSWEDSNVGRNSNNFFPSNVPFESNPLSVSHTLGAKNNAKSSGATPVKNGVGRPATLPGIQQR